MDQRQGLGVSGRILFSVSLSGLVVAGLALFYLTLPDVLQLKHCMTASMNQVRLCPGDARYTPLSKIAPEIVHAVIVSEDASFFSHKGFDWHELRESLSANLQTAGFKRGGSTLTQQLAKNVFLNKEKSLLRKLREAALTVQLEKNFTKNELIERYLNVVEFGDNIYGIKAAASHYFSKAPADLHVLEAAFLAFLLPNPKGYSASFQQKTLTPFAKKMLRQILRRMANFNKIEPHTLEIALAKIDEFPWYGLLKEQLDEPTPNEIADTPEVTDTPEVADTPEPIESPAAEPSAEEMQHSEDSTWD